MARESIVENIRAALSEYDRAEVALEAQSAAAIALRRDVELAEQERDSAREELWQAMRRFVEAGG